MRTKLLIIVAALALGGVAAVMAANYLRGARTDIASESEVIGVLVAQEDLPRGLSAEELIAKKLVKVQDVPRRFVAADAVSSERLLENQVLAVPVSAGEQVTKARFQYPAQAGLAFSVPADYVAVTIEVDEVTGVNGMLKPGDQVVVFSSFQPKDKLTAWTQTTIVKARVLAVGAEVSSESGSGASSGQGEQKRGVLASNASAGAAAKEQAYKTVTLALSVADAEHVVFSREFGSVHLALLPQNAKAPKRPKSTSFYKTDLKKTEPVQK